MSQAVILIGGIDATGGAGLAADMRATAALGVAGVMTVTTVVSLTPDATAHIEQLPIPVIERQLTTALDTHPDAVVKTGMLGSAETIAMIASTLARRSSAPLIVDPVMAIKERSAGTATDVVDAFTEHLLPAAGIITPNVLEAARLTNLPPAQTPEALPGVARALFEQIPGAVLVTGGHRIEGDTAIDILMTTPTPVVLTGPKVGFDPINGAGCTLAAAVAAMSARGHRVDEAARLAHAWLHGALPLARRDPRGRRHLMNAVLETGSRSVRAD
jgi:hydroxymethylpyrimidine kinase/phosphomethylpyrimidine kinase